MKQFQIVRSLLVLVLFGIAQRVDAAFVTYFDDDNTNNLIDTDTTAMNGYNPITDMFVGRPTNMDHSQDGFDSFLAGIAAGSDIGLEDFERFDGEDPFGNAGQAIMLDLQFDRLPPAMGTIGVTAELNGIGQVAKLTDTGINAAGRFPVWIDINGSQVQGDQYFDTNFEQLSFTIEFSKPITAFGFFGTDVGDFDGQIQLTVTPTMGANQVLNVPHQRSGVTNVIDTNLNATLIFFGFTSDTPFTKVAFTNIGQNPDRFGFDKLVIATTNEVPEPSTMALVASGLICLGGGGLLRRRQGSAATA
jgi:hypothetical protein